MQNDKFFDTFSWLSQNNGSDPYHHQPKVKSLVCAEWDGKSTTELRFEILGALNQSMKARVSSLSGAIFFAVRRQSSSWLCSVHFTGGDDNFFVERWWTGLMLCEHWRWCPSWLRNVPYCGGDDDKIFPLWGVGPLRFVLGFGSHSHQESVVVPSLTSVCLLGECHTPWRRNEPFSIPCCGVRGEVLSS